MIVYHGTSAAAARDILKRGVRMEESSKGYFGMGFYTTEKQELAKSNYADFSGEDEESGVVLAFQVKPRARLLDLRKSADWDRYMALRWQGRKVTEFMHRDDFHKIMQALKIDGLYDDSFDGWVFYNPKVLTLIKTIPCCRCLLTSSRVCPKSEINSALFAKISTTRLVTGLRISMMCSLY